MERKHSLSLLSGPKPTQTLADLGDEELMRLCAGDSHAAFACLVRRYQERVRAYCARRLGSAGADDVAQEAFVAIYSARHDYRNQRRFRAFLFTVVERRCQNALRGSRLRRHSALQDADALAQDPDGLARLLTDERRRELHAWVEGLPEPQRVAVWMRFTAGLEHGEIAAIVGCPEATVRSRVHLGLSKLRTLCAKRGGV